MFPNGMIKNGNQKFLMCTTLSDRLKQAGIMESKPECEAKPKKNNKCKKRKNYFTMSYSKKHIRRKMQSIINNRQKNLEDLDKTLPNNAKTSPTNPHNNREMSKNSVLLDECVATDSGSENYTTIASLDFIQDFHNYKKKTRTTTEGDKIKSTGKILKTTLSNQTPRPDSQKSNDGNNKRNLKKTRVLLSVNETLRTKNTKFESEQNNENKEVIDVTPPHHQISDDVAKIDKSFLRSIISIVTGKEKKNSGGKIIENEIGPEKNKKMTGKAFFERKKIERDLKEQHLRSSQENGSSFRFQMTGTQRPQHGEKISKFRNLTKSEQIQQVSDVSGGTRKKRKLKNEHLDNNDEEFIETSLPSEVSKIAVVKELWRRDGEKKSENSLSSRSTSTLPEGDDVPGTKNLESYKLLLKFVDQEIRKITSKPEEKDTKEKDGNMETLKQKRLRNIYNKLIENSQEISALKKNLIQTKPEKCNSIPTGKHQISETILKYSEGVPEDENSYWKLLGKEGKKSENLPSQLTQNWAILNRLEQAFLALGTPNFPNQNASGVSSNNTRGTANHQKQHVAAADSKKIHRNSKDQLKKDNKDSLKPKSLKARLQQEVRNRRALQDSHLKKIENEQKNILKKNQEWSDCKKDSIPQKLQLNYDKVSKDLENKSKQIKKKLQTKSQKSLPKPTDTANSLQNVKREKTPTSAQTPKPKIGKPPELFNWKLGIENISDIAGENLNRKPTFSVISATDASIIKQRRSKSCEKNDINTVKFSKAVIQDRKDMNEENSIDEVKLKSKSKENDRGNKVASSISPRKLTKNPVQETPTQNSENSKNDVEKRCVKKNSENIMSLIRTQSREKKKIEKSTTLNEIAQQVVKKDVSGNNLSEHIGRYIKMYGKGKGSTSIDRNCTDDTTNGCNIKERGLKKRSILSVSLNQSWKPTDQMLEQPEKNENFDIPTLYSNTENFLRNSSTNEINTLQVVVDNVGSSDSIKTYTKEIPKKGEPCSDVTMSTFREHPYSSSSIFSVTSNTVGTECNHLSHATLIIGAEKTLKKEPLWEQDVSHYLDIVKDIMSQYNRIDGLLKQSEKLNQIPVDAAYEKNTPSKHNSHIINLQEYRKRIISEYQAVPIFEYKSKQNETPEGKYYSGDSRRTLSVAKDSATFVDEDVKDHYPKVKKILSSTLYVEPENLIMVNEHRGKSLEKKASLQDSVISQNDRRFNLEKRLRSFSTTNIDQISHDQRPECESSSTDYLLSVSLTNYNQDTNGQEGQL